MATSACSPWLARYFRSRVTATSIPSPPHLCYVWLAPSLHKTRRPRSATQKHTTPERSTAMRSLWALENISWFQLATRVWKEIEKDRAFGRAAELSYYFLLALFPLLIFLTSVIGII